MVASPVVMAKRAMVYRQEELVLAFCRPVAVVQMTDALEDQVWSVSSLAVTA
jgi:hypothetical protein